MSAAPHFTDGANIGYVNHLLFSVSEDPVWGAPVVRPRCLVGQADSAAGYLAVSALCPQRWLAAALC